MQEKTTPTPEEQAAETARLQAYLDEKMANARAAAAALEHCTQQEVDAMVQACAKAVFDHAEELAQDAVEETGMGVVEDKIAKNKNKARLIWWSLKDKKSVGIIERDGKEPGVVKVAKPVGVVSAITPVTNPIVTPMSNAMFALKGRNPIIISPHHSAKNSSAKTVAYINAYLEKLGAPKHAVQVMELHSRELTRLMLAASDVGIATGGMGMVRAVYSSGKPALGVGAGNVQTLVDTGVDLPAAAKMIVDGRAFDNGIICTGEQSVIAPAADYDTLMKAMAACGAYIAPIDQRDALREAAFPEGTMNRHLVGKSALAIAQAAGITVPEGTRVILVEADGPADILGSEKMFPLLAGYRYTGWEQAVDIARANLDQMGKGHSICLHTHDSAKVEYAALHTEVSRVVVNQSCASSGGGSFQNGLNPTNTLGCGTWGNNSIAENLTYYHLLNVSRIAYKLEDRAAPPDDVIWAPV